MLMSSSFSARSAESLDSTPPQQQSRSSRHRTNLSCNTTPALDIAKNGTSDSYSSKEHNHNNLQQNAHPASADLTHNNNKKLKSDDIHDRENEFQVQNRNLKSISPLSNHVRPMSPEQILLDNNLQEPQLKVTEASRTSEMPDLSEQPSTFTRSAASTATFMAESTKTTPTHNASFDKLDEQVRKMLPLKQRMALSEDESIDDKVSEEDQDALIEAKNKSIDISLNENPSKGSLDDDEKETTDEKSSEMKTQEEKDQLELLKQKSEEASKTIERLKMQLQQQSDYEALKREVLLLKNNPSLKPMTSPSGQSSNSPSPVLPGQLPVPTSVPGNPSPISSLTGGISTPSSSSLEMLLLERAKLLQNQNPVMKAFAELQGSSNIPGFPGSGVRHPLFPMPPSGMLPTPGTGMESALGMMNEEMMAQWRKSLEQSSAILQQPLSTSPSSRRSEGSTVPGIPPLTPPSFPNPGSNTRLSTHSPSSVTGSLTAPQASSASPIPMTDNTTESRKRSRSQSPGDSMISTKIDEHVRPPSSTSGIIATNGGDGSKTHSEDGTSSPPMRLDSKSPMKPPSDSDHPSQSPSLPTLPPNIPAFSSHSMHPHFPSHNPAISLPLPLPLSVPPIISTGRIPKSDPMEGRLQDMLRYNMEKYAGQALDTLGMSRRVRELLSVHNIGQRLFAKYVLGLSQGTVSELLSKPKCWEKLTEKGRDSYRKMHAWAYDENAVMLLKSLIPRKGELVRSAAPLLIKDDRTPPMNTFGQNGEERIAKILNEATRGLNAHGLSPLGPHKDMPNPNIASSLALPISQIPPTLPSNLPQSPKSSPGGGIGSADDSNNMNPQERMSKLYQEELARIMRHRGLPPLPLPPGLPLPPTSTPLDSIKSGDTTTTTNSTLPPGLPAGLNPFLPGLAGGLFGQKGLGTVPTSQPSELQRAMDIYHQEFSRLQQRALAEALRAQNGGTPKDFVEGSGGSGAGSPGEKSDDLSTRDSNIEKTPEKDSTNNQYSPIHQQDPPIGKSPGSTLFPSTGPPPGTAEDIAASLSPLQRMASITNSLVTQPPLTGGGGHGNRPMRAILPPITQQQFDQFSHLNTDETVRRIKEILSQYSISQRLFGESVLGLSQGSVSDLLARPKPWHMLTQKGREPFIRMKLFLDDENAVHKLVASQYKIAPEKLMRTGEYSGALFPPPKQMPKLPDFSRMGLLEPPMLPSSLRFGLNGPVPGIPSSTPNTQDMMIDRSPPILDPLAIHRKLLSQQKAIGGSPGAPSNNGFGSAGPLSGSIPPSPSLYEMAALTNELDTQTVTTKVKEILLSNNVGQKLFGEAVLGLSQGSVSELLSKPKPWHMLSIKGREPFIRMQLWLNDPQNIEKLQLLKNERRESSSAPGKRKRLAGGSGVDSNSDRSSPADPSDIYASSADSPGSVSAAKKQRVLFSDEQKEALKIAFALDPYPSTAAMDYLSQELNLESRSISNWFHNHRMRLKQQLPQGMDRIAPLLNKNSSNSSGGEQQNAFDPIKFKLIFHQRLLEMQQGQHTGSDDGKSGGNVPAVSMSTLMMRQFGYAPLMGLGGDLSSLDSMLSRTSGINAGLGEEGIIPGSGLDLSYKPRGQSDDEKDSIAAESPTPLDEPRSDNEDSNAGSVGDALTIERQRAAQVALASAALQQAVQAASGRSSRRKPVAPQWVRPEWMDDKKDSDNEKSENTENAKEADINSGIGGKENNLTINGVCVMNSYAFDGKNTTDDEEANAMDHDNNEVDNGKPSDTSDSNENKVRRSPSVSPHVALNSNSNNTISVTESAEGNS